MSLPFYNLNHAPIFLHATIHFKVDMIWWFCNLIWKIKPSLWFDVGGVIFILPYVVTNANTFKIYMILLLARQNPWISTTCNIKCMVNNSKIDFKTKQKMNKHEFWFSLNKKYTIITQEHMDPWEFICKKLKCLETIVV
jgi:hypothetical protein